LQPRELSTFEMLEAAADASYTITRIQIVVEGVTSQGNCETCNKAASFLTVPETGQKFELSGKHEPGLTLRLKAEVSDWESDHPTLTLPPYQR
jgi:hypothetical protein